MRPRHPATGLTRYAIFARGGAGTVWSCLPPGDPGAASLGHVKPAWGGGASDLSRVDAITSPDSGQPWCRQGTRRDLRPDERGGTPDGKALLDSGVGGRETDLGRTPARRCFDCSPTAETSEYQYELALRGSAGRGALQDGDRYLLPSLAPPAGSSGEGTGCSLG